MFVATAVVSAIVVIAIVIVIVVAMWWRFIANIRLFEIAKRWRCAIDCV